jgi:hypothetical protein
VNKKDVYDHRAKQSQGQWNVAVHQEQNCGDDLKQKNNDPKTRREDRSEELSGDPGRRGGGKEVQEAVQAESQKNDPEQQPGYDRCGSHKAFSLISILSMSIVSMIYN